MTTMITNLDSDALQNTHKNQPAVGFARRRLARRQFRPWALRKQAVDNYTSKAAQVSSTSRHEIAGKKIVIDTHQNTHKNPPPGGYLSSDCRIFSYLISSHVILVSLIAFYPVFSDLIQSIVYYVVLSRLISPYHILHYSILSHRTLSLLVSSYLVPSYTIPFDLVWSYLRLCRLIVSHDIISYLILSYLGVA